MKTLPADALPSPLPTCPPRIVVPQIRTCLMAGEPLRLRAMVLGAQPKAGVLSWRPLGTGPWQKTPLRHVARGVYEGELSAEAANSDLEYSISIETDRGVLTLPATAPRLNQSVVVVGGPSVNPR